MTDCITEYMKFCEQITIPCRTLRCFPNNQPWISSDSKALLNEKKAVRPEGEDQGAQGPNSSRAPRGRCGRDEANNWLQSGSERTGGIPCEPFSPA